jgi:hypothetical protein
MYFINEHEIVQDKAEKLEPWTSYDRVIRLAMDFIKNCPVDQGTNLPWYLLYSCFWTDPIRPTIWPDNPAGKFAWAVTTLLKYYPYSGDQKHIEIVRSMLDQLIEHRVPSDWAWGNAPYASANPGTGVYFGARADGEYATEPDKVAQVGRAFIDFYEITGEEKYLKAGEDCARVLVSHLSPGDELNSPVPFRVAVRDGRVIEAYTSDMIPLVRLFDELIRLGKNTYQSSRDLVMDWIRKYPLKNNLWKGYFEDIRLDVENGNRDQLSALETARYLLGNKSADQNWKSSVPALIHWVKDTFGAQPYFSAIAIHEQKFCYFVMGSHTARFASLCALWYEASGEEMYREIAVRSLNWATYMANENGTVTVGVDHPDYYNQCWFTDGYFDYVPHFIDVMASIPELAPDDSDHMLQSSTVIREINYQPSQISYKTFDQIGSQRLKLTFEPILVKCDHHVLPRLTAKQSREGWYFDRITRLLEINHSHSNLFISGRDDEN